MRIAAWRSMCPRVGSMARAARLYIEGVQSEYVTLEAARVPVRQLAFYQLSFVLGGTNPDYTSTITPMMEFSCGGESYRMDHEYLASVLQPFVGYGERCGRPIYIGGFGANWNSFNHEGLNWVRDMDALYSEQGINCNYFIYRNDYFGVYRLDGTVNGPLRDYFMGRPSQAEREGDFLYRRKRLHAPCIFVARKRTV